VAALKAKRPGHPASAANTSRRHRALPILANIASLIIYNIRIAQPDKAVPTEPRGLDRHHFLMSRHVMIQLWDHSV
jgi:hypothetical protein